MGSIGVASELPQDVKPKVLNKIHLSKTAKHVSKTFVVSKKKHQPQKITGVYFFENCMHISSKMKCG